jgi:hypothetical protein
MIGVSYKANQGEERGKTSSHGLKLGELQGILLNNDYLWYLNVYVDLLIK